MKITKMNNPKKITDIFGTYTKKIGGFVEKNQLELFLANEPKASYDRKLIFN